MKTPQQSNLGWAQSFKATAAAPIIADRIFSGKTEMMDFLSGDTTAINGLHLSVVSDDIAERGAFQSSSGAGTPNAKVVQFLTDENLSGGTQIEITRNNGRYVLSHKNNKKVTNEFVKITTDSQGHIISTSAVTASDLPSHTHDIAEINNLENALTGYTSINTVIHAGSGLTGGGSLSGDVTINLSGSPVSPGTYNTVKVNQHGIVVSGTNVEGYNGKLTEDITATDDIGGVKSGQTFSAGTFIETVVKQILTKEVNPIATLPHNTTILGRASFEYGSAITDGISLEYNDGYYTAKERQYANCVPTKYEFYSGTTAANATNLIESGTTISLSNHKATASTNLMNSVVITAPIYIKSVVYYNQSTETPLTSLGNEFPSVKIASGSTQHTASYSVYKNWYYAFMGNMNTIDGIIANLDETEMLSNSFYSKKLGTNADASTFNENNCVIICYPSTATPKLYIRGGEATLTSSSRTITHNGLTYNIKYTEGGNSGISNITCS